MAKRPSKEQRAARDREATAYHEAGHAVMCHVLKRPTRYVALVDDSPDHVGLHVRFRTPALLTAMADDEIVHSPKVVAAAIGDVMILIAGPLAEEMWTGRRNHRKAGSDDDKLAAFVERLTGSMAEVRTFYRWLELRVRNEFNRVENWAHVRRIARDLLAEGRIPGKRVADLALYGTVEETGREWAAADAELRTIRGRRKLAPEYGG